MKYFFLTVLVILTACGGSETPDNLLSPAQMTKVLTEVHLLESKVRELGIKPLDSSQVVYDHYEKLLFEELEIDKKQYESSFNYYLDHPKEFERIYGVVVDSLLQKEKTASE